MAETIEPESLHKGHRLWDDQLSASRVKTFAACPLKWWFHYVEREQRTPPNPGYFERGLGVHEGIENVLRDDPTIRDEGILSHRFKEQYRKYDPDCPEYMYEQGLDCCEVAAKYLDKHGQDLEIQGLEVDHEYHIGGDLNVDFNAKMDVVTDEGIIDWKTGRRTNSDGEVRSYIPRDELIQGMVYAGAFLNKYGRYPEYVNFVYLGGEEFGSVKPTKDLWDKMKAYARSLMQSMGSGEFPAKTGSQCGICDYRYVCPAQESSMANVSYELY